MCSANAQNPVRECPPATRTGWRIGRPRFGRGPFRPAFLSGSAPESHSRESLVCRSLTAHVTATLVRVGVAAAAHGKRRLARPGEFTRPALWPLGLGTRKREKSNHVLVVRREKNAPASKCAQVQQRQRRAHSGAARDTRLPPRLHGCSPRGPRRPPQARTHANGNACSRILLLPPLKWSSRVANYGTRAD